MVAVTLLASVFWTVGARYPGAIHSSLSSRLATGRATLDRAIPRRLLCTVADQPHADDAAVPEHPAESAGGYAAALPARGFLRDVLRRREGRRADPQCRADQAEPGADVRHPVSRGGELRPAADQGRAARGDLRSDRASRSRGRSCSARSRTSSPPARSPICRCSMRSGTTSSRRSVREPSGGYGFAFIDLTTGDFRLTELADDKELADELARVQPAEVLVPRSRRRTFATLRGLVARDGYTFLHDQAYSTPARAFQGAVARWLRLRGDAARRSARRARSCII